MPFGFKDIDIIQDMKYGFGVTRSSYVLYTSFSFWYAAKFLPGGDFFNEACHEDMHNSLLILPFLRLSVKYQW